MDPNGAEAEECCPGGDKIGTLKVSLELLCNVSVF
jgi:hypothetical protein